MDDLWAVMASAIFPELPPEAAREALGRLPGGPELVEAVGRLAAFARPTPAREQLAMEVLEALARGENLPPPRSPLEEAFRAAHREIWEPVVRAAQNLPVGRERLQAAMRAARAWMEEQLSRCP